MYIPFEQLSDQSPIWIYQAEKQLTREQVDTVLQRIQPFLDNWTSHGRSFRAGAVVKHQFFLLIGIEQPNYELSCCTVDSAVHFLRQLKADCQINFLDRNQVVFKEGEKVFALPISQVKEQLQQGIIHLDTEMFDNTIQHKADLAHKWLIPVKDSWLKMRVS